MKQAVFVVQSLNHVQLFATTWALACQASLSMGFPSKEYWSGLPFPSPGDLPDQGIEPVFFALAVGFYTLEPPGKMQLPIFNGYCICEKVKVLVSQQYVTLCNLMDWSPLDSSVQKTFQARILEWVTISFSLYLPTRLFQPCSLPFCHAFFKFIFYFNWRIESHGCWGVV